MIYIHICSMMCDDVCICMYIYIYIYVHVHISRERERERQGGRERERELVLSLSQVQAPIWNQSLPSKGTYNIAHRFVMMQRALSKGTIHAHVCAVCYKSRLHCMMHYHDAFSYTPSVVPLKTLPIMLFSGSHRAQENYAYS